MSGKYCSGCRRQVVGHPGPYGKNCTLEVLEGDLEGAAKEIKTESSSPLDEMAKQMSFLVASVQAITLSHEDLKKETADLKTKQSSDNNTNQHNQNMTGPLNPPPTTADTLISLPGGARVSERKLLAAKRGEFIHLADFIPNIEPSTALEAVISNENISFRE